MYFWCKSCPLSLFPWGFRAFSKSLLPRETAVVPSWVWPSPITQRPFWISVGLIVQRIVNSQEIFRDVMRWDMCSLQFRSFFPLGPAPDQACLCRNTVNTQQDQRKRSPMFRSRTFNVQRTLRISKVHQKALGDGSLIYLFWYRCNLRCVSLKERWAHESSPDTCWFRLQALKPEI